MKILLQILWGWSVLANGAVGIQVGTIQTNNQNIKLMKMNFTSPVWLQSASNVGGGKEYISFVSANGNLEIILSCDGNLRIVSTYNGDEMIQNLSNIYQQRVSIQSDPNTEVFIYGKVTSFNTSVSPGGTAKISELNTLYAKSLTELSCYRNQLTSLDVSANTALTSLGCYENQLTSLDVSANTALTELSCFGNQLTSLDVSSNTALTNLSCNNNQLTSLDVSANTALTNLSCNDNQLTSLDVSANTALTELICFGNQLTSLDVSANTALTRLICNNNQLTSLDVSANTALTSLGCFENQLTSLDVSANTALTELICYDNPDITDVQSVAVNSSMASTIADLIGNATSVDGTVTLRHGDEFNQTIIDAAMDKGWDVQYAE